MRRVHVASSHAEAHLIEGLLASHGIEATLDCGSGFDLGGDLPGVSIQPSVFVADADAERAAEIIRQQRSAQG